MKTFSFDDFDGFAYAVRDVDCTMLMRNPRRRSWSISHTYLPRIHAQLGRLGSGNIAEGQSWLNGYVLYLPLTAECAYSGNGTFLGSNSFIIMEPGCEFCISTKDAHDWCSIFVPTEYLARGGDHEEPSPGSEKMLCRVTRTNRRIANQFWACVSQIMIAAAKCPQFESTPAAACAEAELRKLATWIVGKRQQAGELHIEGRPRYSRPDIIGRCRQLLEEREGKLVRVAELAAAGGVSERTLLTIFNEFFGMGPAHYLQLRQLNQVHRVLKAADAETVSVTGVLAQHGVWAFGHFARRYRQLFGELPSETLRAKRRS